MENDFELPTSLHVLHINLRNDFELPTSIASEHKLELPTSSQNEFELPTSIAPEHKLTELTSPVNVDSMVWYLLHG